MRPNRERRHSAHEVRRVARYRSGGINNSRNRIGITTTLKKKLQYEEMIAGIGYGANQGRIYRRRKHNKTTITATSNSDSETDSDGKEDSEIITQERQRAEQDASRWFVQQLGNMPQDRPEGVFRLLGGNLNSASTKDVHDQKITDILRIIETWDVQAGGLSKVGIKWRNMARSK